MSDISDIKNIENSPNGANQGPSAAAPSVKETHKDLPNGAIQGLCTASAGALTLEIAFLGFWAFGGKFSEVPWSDSGRFAFALLCVSFVFLVSVPFMVTSADLTIKSFKWARKAYVTGMFFLMGGLSFALFPSLNEGKVVSVVVSDLSKYLNVLGLLLITAGGIFAAMSTPSPTYSKDGSVSLGGEASKEKRIEIYNRQSRLKYMFAMIGIGALMQGAAIFL